MPEEVVHKEGWMNKRTVDTWISKSSHQYWFVLKGSVLWYYENSQTTYFPLGAINLRFVQRVEPATNSDSSKCKQNEQTNEKLLSLHFAMGSN